MPSTGTPSKPKAALTGNAQRRDSQKAFLVSICPRQVLGTLVYHLQLLTYDRFSAAAMGLPVLLKETDIQTEYPADVDDENITEKGFLPTLPGESTRLSSALALFNVSRILTKVLDYICPSSASYEVSISKIHSIEDELDEWLRNLPPHLRLQFSQDKPSTNVTGSRSPLLVSSPPQGVLWITLTMN